MKKRQLAKLGITLGLVAAVGVGGTLALLSAQSEVVTNTFTVGKGLHDTDITLDEAEVDPNTGKEIPEGERVQSNSYLNLEQGAKLDKDPTVTITNTAADCYVFVEITGLDETYYDVKIDENWVKTSRDNIWAYRADNISEVGTIVRGGLQGDLGLVFDGVKIQDKAPLYTGNDEDGWTSAKLPNIVVKACAVQANNNTYTDALAAATFAE